LNDAGVEHHGNFELRSSLVSVEDPGMPTYQYRCKKCGKSFERSEHIAEHEKSHPLCPKCSSRQVEPVLADFYAKTSKKS
jgi:putative FmdB family regulatory protein